MDLTPYIIVLFTFFYKFTLLFYFMSYPSLENTPIKEIIFSISYQEIVDKECFEKFVNLDFIKEKFKEINPSINNSFEIKNGGVRHIKDNSGFHLKNDNEVLQMRTGSLSYHHLHTYIEYNTLLCKLIEFWKIFDDVTKDHLTITSVSVRYINLIEEDEENTASNLVQLYPKQSNDRNVINFQNSISFSFLNKPEYIVNVVSTKPKLGTILLDITVNHKVDSKNSTALLKEIFEPLQEIKNKVFFDSITTRALLKYTNKKI
jgi:uncharacterized protein (TIGR04255 family)